MIVNSEVDIIAEYIAEYVDIMQTLQKIKAINPTTYEGHCVAETKHKT